LDEAFRSAGATVVPAGTGNTALQAQIVLEFGVTVIAASTAHFEQLVDHIEAEGHRLPDAWKVRAAYLGGEFGDWAAKRRAIEDRLRMSTFTFYGTGDIGLIGYECAARDGYHLSPDVFVEVCDESGAPVAAGTPGELVVTNLNEVWP